MNFSPKEVSIIREAIYFSYSHGFITEGAAMAVAGCDRIQFRSGWIQWLKENPGIAKATSNDGYLNL